MKTNQTKTWGSTTLAVLLTLLCLPGQQNLRAQPESHHFTSIAKLSDNTIALALDGRVAPSFNSYFDLYVLETATNLNDWTPLVTLLRNNRVPDEVGWIDTNVSLIEKRFYRTFTNHLITAFPKPTGPFAVGTFSRVIADPARTNRYRYNNQTNSFMFTCWYPAEAQAGLLPGAAYDTQVAQDASRYGDFGENSSWASIVPQLKGHSLPNAPIARGTNRYPIILLFPWLQMPPEEQLPRGRRTGQPRICRGRRRSRRLLGHRISGWTIPKSILSLASAYGLGVLLD